MSEEPRRLCCRCGKPFVRVDFEYVCPECREKERLQGIQQTKVKREDEWKSICPPLFASTSLDRLPERAQEFLQAEWSVDTSFLFFGPTRRGKSRVAWEIMRMAHLEGRSVRGLTAVQFSRDVASEYGRDAVAAVRWLSDLEAVDVLLLDDLGKGKLTERAQSELYGVLDHRSLCMKATLITTNMTDDELRATLSPDRADPLIARIEEFYESVEL